jgi:hypothetical protein
MKGTDACVPSLNVNGAAAVWLGSNAVVQAP